MIEYLYYLLFSTINQSTILGLFAMKIRVWDVPKLFIAMTLTLKSLIRSAMTFFTLPLNLDQKEKKKEKTFSLMCLMLQSS